MSTFAVVPKVLTGRGVVDRLPGELTELGAGSRLLLVADPDTYRAAGEEAAGVLGRAGFAVTLCLLHRPGGLKADEEALAEIAARLAPECGLLLAVGSGTINDLTKYAAYRAGRPYAVVATAPSMDGYASPVAALTEQGRKITRAAACPRAVFGDPDILGSAPPALIRAGFGDLLGKYTALGDWYLGHVITGEGYSAAVAAAVRRAVDECAASGANGADYIRTLFTALVESGLGMLRWGNSRPASGSEHHVAHFLEMREYRGKGQSHLHGIRVGVAEVHITSIYRRLFQREAAAVRELIHRRRPESAAAFRARLQEAYGPAAPGIMAQLEGCYRCEATRRERQAAVVTNWDHLREWVRENVPPPQRIGELLAAAGAPSSFTELGVYAPLARTILDNAQEVRTRYTVLRLAEDLGLSPGELCPVDGPGRDLVPGIPPSRVPRPRLPG